jgi:glucose-1-phosphate cytidylyltransferase
MKTVILCGGQGTRLREETEFRPKPMVEIGGRPILWHIMKHYARHGLKEFVLCLGYKGHVIKDFFLNYETRMTDVTVQLGGRESFEIHGRHDEDDWTVTLAETGLTAQTGARVQRVSSYLRDEGPFCLTYGDGVSDVDLTALIAFHKSHGRIGTVTGVRPTSRFGELSVDGDRVVQFAEKPLSEGLISGGFFIFEPAFLDRYLDGRDDLILEREPLQKLAADGELVVREHSGFWQPMDTFRDWKLLEDLWASGNAPWKATV